MHRDPSFPSHAVPPAGTAYPRPPRQPLRSPFLALLTAVVLSLAPMDLDAQRGPAEPQDGSFFDDFEGDQIDSSKWQVATWTEHGGQTGRDRTYVEDGKLHLVFINDSEEGYLSAAIQTWDTFLYGRWEARLKPSDVPGVLNSMYTIDWDGGDGTRQEVDIEFLTYTFGDDSGEVHLAVHAANLDSWDSNIVLDFNPSDDFHVWGFDITPEYIQWFVDEQVLYTYYYDEKPVTVDTPYQLKFNVWSQHNWIQGPPEADVETVYQIDWIRFTPAQVTPTPTPTPTPEPSSYGYLHTDPDTPIIETGGFLGTLQVEFAPWVYSYRLGNWWFIPDPNSDLSTEPGAWIYITNPEE